MKRSLALLSFALMLSCGHAAPAAAPQSAALAGAALTRDLGRNLLYHRIRMLPVDLPPVDPARRQPRVIDLRYLEADAAATAALHAWIKTHATPRTPVFILANSATDRDLVAPFSGRGSSGSVLVIGAATRGFHPDIAVETTPEDERRAYDAFDSGVELATLLTEHPNKIRNDEASLSRDRSSEPPAATLAERSKDPAPPIDAALQRAVHLHRTLVALRKI